MNNLIKLLIPGIIVVCIWYAAKLFSDAVSDYEVVAPDKGVKCIIVSRSFNTSVDCWEDKE